jgi:hypothetical protein
MFQNVRPSRFWEDNLRQRYGFVGPRKAFTDEDCMHRAMGLFINLFDTLQYGYGFLVTLYQSVLAVEHDQRMKFNERLRTRCFETIQIPAQAFTLQALRRRALSRSSRVHVPAKNCAGN